MTTNLYIWPAVSPSALKRSLLFIVFKQSESRYQLALKEGKRTERGFPEFLNRFLIIIKESNWNMVNICSLKKNKKIIARKLYFQTTFFIVTLSTGGQPHGDKQF